MDLSLRSVQGLCLVVVVITAGCGGAAPAEDPTEPATTASTNSLTEPATTVSTNPPTETASNGTLEMHYINVGQSASVLVVGPTGETLLYDTGHYHDDGEHVLEYLQKHDIDRIDHLVVSHNDADHIGGNAALIEYFETEADGIGAIYDPGIAASTQTYNQYLDAVETHDVTLYETREGDSIQFEGADISVLGPPEPYLDNEGRNENSIVLKFTYGTTSFLLTGDAEDDQEEYLVSKYGDRLNATVLKAGHHGSSSSTSPGLLDAVQPKAVVISSAYDSQYGHPTEEVLARLSVRNIPTYWTGTHGNVVLVSDGKTVSIRTQESAPTEPEKIREADPLEPGAGGEVVERARIGGSGDVSRTTVMTDGGTTRSPGSLSVVTVHADAAGDDRENLNDEYVVFENTGDTELDLSGWTIQDAADHTYTVPDGTTLAPGERLTVHTGSGSDTESDLYWGSGSPIWNNAGDTVIVHNSEGDVVLRETYE